MAARRLLIIMLVLLGLSTLAAALVPQRTLKDRTNGTTTTTQSTSATATSTPAATPAQVAITVGPRKLPLVRAHVGDQFTLLVTSILPREISIPEFGLVSFATPDAPARFELLSQTPGTFGILFAASGKVAAKLEVVTPSEKPKKQRQGKGERSKNRARSRARGGSG